MKLKRYIEFVNENVSIYKGDFKVTEDMVSNGMLIKEMIPREVTGTFFCSELELTSLEGSPESVGGSFWCTNNLLTSLEGCPKYVKGIYFRFNNKVDLNIENDYIVSGFRNDNYYLGLLKYMNSKHIDLTKIKSWPKNFLTPELIQSVKGINKFKL